MPALHLVEGPVGAGKSTFAEHLGLVLGAPALNLDEWMVVLFAQDRPADDFLPWYGERKARCTEQIWRVACAVLDAGSDVVLELGLVGRPEREAFYRRVDGTDHPLRVYLLEPPRSVRQERVRQRNAERSGTFRMEVSEEIFDLADRAWQSPDAAERAARRVLEVADSRGPIPALSAFQDV